MYHELKQPDNTLTIDEYEEHCHSLERQLKDSGFNPTEAYLLMDRYVSGLSIKELSKKYGTSSNVIVNRLDQLLDELKQKGVTFGT